MEEVKITNNSYVCLECGNENALEDVSVGDVIECEFCGIEYEVVEGEDGELKLVILEEEK